MKVFVFIYIKKKYLYIGDYPIKKNTYTTYISSKNNCETKIYQFEQYYDLFFNIVYLQQCTLHPVFYILHVMT